MTITARVLVICDFVQATHSEAHYLTALAFLLNKPGYARAVDVARRLQITRPAVHRGVKSLKRKNWVIEDERHFLSLTDEGWRMARRVRNAHLTLEEFFMDILHLDQEEAHKNACATDHHLTPSAAIHLLAFLKYLRSHPLGLALMADFTTPEEGLSCQEGQCSFCQSYLWEEKDNED